MSIVVACDELGGGKVLSNVLKNVEDDARTTDA